MASRPFSQRFQKKRKGSSILDALSPAAKADALRQLNEAAPKAASAVNKFGVSKTEDRTSDGETFASKLEMRVWKRLCQLIDPKRIEKQVKFELVPKQVAPSGDKIRAVEYRADFVIDELYVLDAKGQILPEYKLKRKLFLHRYGKEIIELKNMKDVDAFVQTLPQPK